MPSDAPHPTPVDPAEVREVLAKVYELSGWLYDWMTDDDEDHKLEQPREYERGEVWEQVRRIRDLSDAASLSAPVPPPLTFDSLTTATAELRGTDEAEAAEYVSEMLADLPVAAPVPPEPQLAMSGLMKLVRAEFPERWPWREIAECGGPIAGLTRDEEDAVARLAPPSSIDTSTEGGES